MISRSGQAPLRTTEALHVAHMHDRVRGMSIWDPEFPDDYREWTRYSLGNPDMWRRVFRGRLVYACARNGSWFVGDQAGEAPFEVNQAGNFADAVAAAEAWCVLNPEAKR